MPGYLLHKNAAVTCAHAGQAMPTLVVPNVKVAQQPLAVMPGPWTVAGCTFPPPPVANGPCVTAVFMTSALQLTSYGMPVLLFDSQALCAPTGTPLLITGTQMMVKGI
jgi:hypothetical protein